MTNPAFFFFGLSAAVALVILYLGCPVRSSFAKFALVLSIVVAAIATVQDTRNLPGETKALLFAILCVLGHLASREPKPPPPTH